MSNYTAIWTEGIYLFDPAASELACLFTRASSVVGELSIKDCRKDEITWISSANHSCVIKEEHNAIIKGCKIETV